MLVMHYDELEKYVGEEAGPSDWIAVDQERINKYADGVGDNFWIHVDEERARKEFGGTIAHGLMVLSMFAMHLKQLLDIQGVNSDLNYGYDKIRFLSVVHGGENVRLSLKILGVEPRGEGKLLRIEFRFEKEGRETPVLIAENLLLLFPKASALASQAKLVPSA